MTRTMRNEFPIEFAGGNNASITRNYPAKIFCQNTIIASREEKGDRVFSSVFFEDTYEVGRLRTTSMEVQVLR